LADPLGAGAALRLAGVAFFLAAPLTDFLTSKSESLSSSSGDASELDSSSDLRIIAADLIGPAAGFLGDGFTAARAGVFFSGTKSVSESAELPFSSSLDSLVSGFFFRLQQAQSSLPNSA